MAKDKLPKDTNSRAVHIAMMATGEIPKEDPIKDEVKSAAAALGRLGGLKGGKARAASLTPEKRKEIALNAANTRWKREEEK